MSLAFYEVESYRGFAEPVRVEFRPLTLVFGYNSAGKSALLRALSLMAESTRPRSVGPLALDAAAIRGATFDELTSRYTQEPFIRLSLGFADASLKRASFKIRDVPERRRQIIETLTIEHGNREHDAEVRWKPSAANLKDSSVYELVYQGRSYPLSLGFQGLVPQGIDESADTPPPVVECLQHLSNELDNLPQSVYWLGPQRVLPSRSREYRARPVRVRPDGADAEDILAYDYLDGGTLVADISAWYQQATRYRLEVRQEGAGTSGRFALMLSPLGASPVQVHIKDTGEGSIQVLPVLVLAAMARHGRLPRHSVLALEHPELHLHPAAHQHLAEFLCRVSQADSQPRLLVETHSENFLLRVQLEIVEGRLPAEHAQIYWIRQAEDGRAAVEHITFNNMGEPRGAWPPGLFSEDIEQARQIIQARRQRRTA